MGVCLFVCLLLFLFVYLFVMLFFVVFCFFLFFTFLLKNFPSKRYALIKIRKSKFELKRKKIRWPKLQLKLAKIDASFVFFFKSRDRRN